MNATAEALSGKILSLSNAELTLVDDFVQALQLRDHEDGLKLAHTQLSASAFAAVWDNPEDDAYDAL